MNVFERIITVICETLLWISTAMIFIILAINTILRYATGASLQWANEVPELLFPWLVMSGVVMAAQRGAHITTTFLVDKLSLSVRRGLGFVVGLTVCGLYGTLAWATWRMLEIVHDEKSPILQVPGSVTYACVMVGMGMLAVLALIAAYRALQLQPAASASDGQPVPEVHW
ncbi:TRAP transporter small permease [Noviherbaspirillum sp. CPCC 100848]|uniref:TRAP transporter small permease protein n=1 Tax=Noviherbaspirillum album TaxID=3080276 RepID=A0ABU6JHI1_9BURK|nr:TRAP transporter small permease [Noviherbaspirillum sp. CPCC 100848]MEC4722755.1 TRAP transporter small permease [Noviherbaspirillum sp. CPCC 100848]